MMVMENKDSPEGMNKKELKDGWWLDNDLLQFT